MDGCRERRGVRGLRTIVKAGTRINSSIIMGADYYESEEMLAENRQKGIPDIGIGEGSTIARAIIDRNTRIGGNVVIQDNPERPDGEGPNWVAREGIIIIPKNAIIPNGTII